MADSKLSALSEVSVPSLSDYTYQINSGPTSNKASWSRVLGQCNDIVDGRLTLTTALPVTTADVTSAGTIYFTPYKGNRISIYDGTRWKLYSFTEKSLSLTLTSGKNYDVFIYDNSGTLTLELSSAWTNDTTRADALTLQDGAYVKSGSTSRRYLGTIRASGSNVTEDSKTKRFVYNYYNRAQRNMYVLETTSSWTYGTNAWRQVNASTSNKVEVVIGVNENAIRAEASGMNSNASTYVGAVGIGIDSTTINSAPIITDGIGWNTYGVYGRPTAIFSDYIGIGYHAINWLETTYNGTSTFYGSYSGTFNQTTDFRTVGMNVLVWQ